MPKASPLRSTFNAGELSPLMDGRVDVAKYNNGCKVMENFIPSVQGPAYRRGGTRFVNEVKQSANRTWLARFEFSTAQAYVLEFGDYYIRFYANHGIVLGTNGLPYEVATPYPASSLTDTDGTLVLDMVQSGDVIYITHPSYPTQKLSRLGNANWTMAAVAFTNGPFKDQNSNRTIKVYTSGVSGNVTLTSTSAMFKTGHVGSLFYLEPEDLSSIKPWASGQEYTTNPYQVYRRSDGKTYQCMTNGTPTGGKVWRTGGDTPIHVYGTQADGDGQGKTGTVVEREGLDWKFIDSGFGYVKITGFISATQVTAVVSSKAQLPQGVMYVPSPGNKTVTAVAATSLGYARLSIPAHGYANNQTVSVNLNYSYDDGSGGPTYPTTNISGTYSLVVIDANTIDLQSLAWPPADPSYPFLSFAGGTVQYTSSSTNNGTYRWAFGAFSDVEGYPDHCTFFRERLTFSKGQVLYFSVSGDFENFARYDDSGQVVADRAIQVTISSDQVNKVKWLAPIQNLLIGTAGGEFLCGENSSSDVFAPANVKIEEQTSEGSRGVIPARVGYSTLFVQRSGRKLKEIAYNIQKNSFVANDMTVLAEHVTLGGITQVAWHKEPYVTLWCARGDGQLLGFTFNSEQDVTGWHRHTLGGNGVVESVCVIPSPDQTRDELWMVVRRTINGTTKRYVEYLEREYRDGDTQASAFYVDAGLTYTGAAATTISGLGHLEGQTVQVLVNGATHPDCVVTNGAIKLQYAGTVINIGLGSVATIQTNRIEAGAGDGTAQGKMKRINKMVIRFHNTLGAKAGPDSSRLDELQFRSPSNKMDQAVPLFTGDKLMEWPDGYTFDGYVMVRQSQPLPITVVSIMPQVVTYDR